MEDPIMMDQAWFEMEKERSRKLTDFVWIPLRMREHIETIGKYGHLGFKEEYYQVASLAVPMTKKKEALGLGGSVLHFAHGHQGYVESGRYIPSDIYERSPRKILGTALVLEQSLNFDEIPVWHLHQDIVLALQLMREDDLWLCPNEGYVEVAGLRREADRHPCRIEMRSDFLLDYLCARKMGLFVESYRSRTEVTIDAKHIHWEGGIRSERTGRDRWEGRVVAIHEGGRPAGSRTTVMHVSRTDVDSELDVPTFGLPSGDAEKMELFSFKSEGRELFSISGAHSRSEWVDPAVQSPRVREDSTSGVVTFITDAVGSHESKETLNAGIRWLWFRSEVVAELCNWRGGGLGWYTRDTGWVSCSPSHRVDFGVNAQGLINIFAEDIASLPDWEQRIWAGFNVSPEGGVSKELLATQMEALPTSTVAPEERFAEALANIDDSYYLLSGDRLFREHPDLTDILKGVHRFRALNEKGLHALAKDIGKLTADSVDQALLRSAVSPPKGENWGSLKLLEKFLAKHYPPDQARTTLTPLFGAYELRHGDAHLAGSDLDKVMHMAGLKESNSPMQNGFDLINNCAGAMEKMSNMLARLRSIDSSEGE